MTGRHHAPCLTLAGGMLMAVMGCGTSGGTAVFSATPFGKDSASASAHTESSMEWRAEKTWVMMVGVLDQMNTDVYGSFEKRDREDQVLLDTLIRRGVPREQTVFLKDAEATLENIKKRFSALLDKTKKGDFLIFYFDGHGTVNGDGEGHLVPYDAPGRGCEGLWRASDVFVQIEERFRGDNVLMMTDCCHSGALSDELKKLTTEKGYACLNSTLSTATSADLWTFTESLIYAFEGQPHVDADHDGEISLGELKDLCWTDMVWFAAQETCFSRNRNFPAKLSLARARARKHGDIGGYCEIRIGKENKWRRAQIVDHEDGAFKFSYYIDDFMEYETIEAGSDRVRPVVRSCFSMDDVIDVRWAGHWHPASILKIDQKKCLHLVRYEGKGADWDGWYAYNHLRLRPDPKKREVEKEATR